VETISLVRIILGMADVLLNRCVDTGDKTEQIFLDILYEGISVLFYLQYRQIYLVIIFVVAFGYMIRIDRKEKDIFSDLKIDCSIRYVVNRVKHFVSG